MDELMVVRTRLRRELPGDGDATEETRLLAGALGGDGTWPDIDYARRDRAAFPALEHVARAVRLARADPPGALRALDAWRRLGIRSENWWFNVIGAPQLVGDALLLLADRLDEPQRAHWGRWLAGTAGGTEMTGQNLVWGEGIVLRHGVLVGDERLVSSAVTRMSGVLRVTDGEGIQRDLSFHQHGAQLYSGSYGLSLTEDLSLWIYAVHGTRWAFGAAEVALFTDFVLDGQQWAVHADGFDFTTMGRAITRPYAHRAETELRNAVRRLRAAGGPRQDELAAFGARLAGDPAAAELVGCRYYPRSDYLAHRRPGWSASVRMSSTRTIPTESINGENLRGRHLGDGVAPIRVGRGPDDGYRGVFPLWDWARLPGITAEQVLDPAALSPRRDHEHGASADVAGWTDGRHGIAVMRLRGTDRLADGWKAWFCFDDHVVALGAGISAPSAGYPLVTTIDQRWGRGRVVAGPYRDQPRYAHHDRIGYVALDGGQALSVTLERRTGAWSDLSVTGSADPISGDVFTVAFDHGPRPDGASYACLILPDVGHAATIEQADAPPVSVLSNTPALQAVRCHRTAVTLIAAHDEGALDLGREP
jgi:chondroitin AC lyase